MKAPPAPATIKNPYPGLRPFEPEEFESFFGRDHQIDELLTRLRDHRFVAVVGLSGSGKSSLVRAGLIHRLQVGHLTSAGSHWKVALFRPGSEPIEGLAAALDEALGKQQDRPAKLRRSTQELMNSTHGGRSRVENLLLVVDQFEEIFRFQRNNQLSDRDAVYFVDLLLAAEQDLSPDYRVYVVLTMRTDYLGDCAQFEGLPEALNRSQYLLPRLTREHRFLCKQHSHGANVGTGPVTVEGDLGHSTLPPLVSDERTEPSDHLSRCRPLAAMDGHLFHANSGSFGRHAPGGSLALRIPSLGSRICAQMRSPKRPVGMCGAALAPRVKPEIEASIRASLAALAGGQ